VPAGVGMGRWKGKVRCNRCTRAKVLAFGCCCVAGLKGVCKQMAGNFSRFVQCFGQQTLAHGAERGGKLGLDLARVVLGPAMCEQTGVTLGRIPRQGGPNRWDGVSSVDLRFLNGPFYFPATRTLRRSLVLFQILSRGKSTLPVCFGPLLRWVQWRLELPLARQFKLQEFLGDPAGPRNKDPETFLWS